MKNISKILYVILISSLVLSACGGGGGGTYAADSPAYKFFTGSDGTHGLELWKSDGSEAGTVMVKDINPGAAGSLYSLPDRFVVFNGLVYFEATDTVHGYGLWKSDGTDTGTVFVKSITPVTSYTAANGALFFAATNTSNGTELWKTDGTEAGTVLVKDIYAGTGSSTPSNLTALNDTLFLSLMTQRTATSFGRAMEQRPERSWSRTYGPGFSL